MMAMSPIDPRLQEALDGERDPGTLPMDLREAFARLMGAANLLQTLPRPARRLMRWLARPRAVTLRLRPAWTLALVAGLAAILLIPTQPTNRPSPGAQEGIAQFVGHFPGARSVEVVGSFNDWSRGSLHLRDEHHDGIWHGAAVLPAGPHEYMFVVDGERWVPDPLAGRYVDDGFGAGRENSLLIVRPAQASLDEDATLR